jgi:hypothetical protein
MPQIWLSDCDRCCQATPLRNEIEARDAAWLGEATNGAERTIAERFGLQQLRAKSRRML